MNFENLLYEVRDSIAFITFNRPKVLNALNRQTDQECTVALRAAKLDPSVRVVILTGAGEKPSSPARTSTNSRFRRQWTAKSFRC